MIKDIKKPRLFVGQGKKSFFLSFKISVYFVHKRVSVSDTTFTPSQRSLRREPVFLRKNKISRNEMGDVTLRTIREHRGRFSVQLDFA